MLAENLVLLRAARRLSQRALGQQLQPIVPQTRIAQWERGVSPDVDHLNQLARMFDVEPSALLGTIAVTSTGDIFPIPVALRRR